MGCSYGSDLSTTRRGVVRYRGLPNALMTELSAACHGRVTETDSQRSALRQSWLRFSLLSTDTNALRRNSSTIVIQEPAPRNAVASSSKASGSKRKHNDDPLELVNERADEITSALETELDRLEYQERQTAKDIVMSGSRLRKIEEQLEDAQRKVDDLKKTRENRRKELQQQQTSLEAIRADIAAHETLSSALDKFRKRPRIE
jgi:vacuolar-type H+-ATPase subunit I/STV1